MTYGYLPSVRSRHSVMASTCIELSFKNNIPQQKIPISGDYNPADVSCFATSQANRRSG